MVWFQNRRSKERRMKQLSSMGARRHYFRGPRRAMRPLRPGMSPDGIDDSPDMMSGPNSGYTYFSAYNKKRFAAFPFETEIHFRRKADFFPEEDTTKSYSGFEPEPIRLQAEGHSHHTG
ncbi:homeobox domain-containing protein [Trichonephila clavipes]|nr:homeobox domain-containing protein [Trichonephila clavipes]